jgi:hypothetical protein
MEVSNIKCSSVIIKEGKVSLAKLSKMLGITLREAVDLLSSFGLQSPISYDDYLQGMETARKAVR